MGFEGINPCFSSLSCLFFSKKGARRVGEKLLFSEVFFFRGFPFFFFSLPTDIPFFLFQEELCGGEVRASVIEKGWKSFGFLAILTRATLFFPPVVLFFLSMITFSSFLSFWFHFSLSFPPIVFFFLFN